MNDIIARVSKSLADEIAPDLADAGRILAELVEEAAYFGDVYSLSYAETLVQIHDFHRSQVGGVPALSFLLATRIQPGVKVDVREEDTSVLLLRVLDHADLPNAQEALRVRVETAQRVSGEVGRHWDCAARLAWPKNCTLRYDTHWKVKYDESDFKIDF